MTYRIGGQVVDQGSGVSGQPVFVVDTGDANPSNWTVEAATTTNADGSWSVVVSSGDLERYHAVTQFEDASTLKNAESKPFVTGQPVVRPVEIPIQFEIPSPAISAGTAIPDSAIEYWPCDEGSGQTLNNAITDNDVSLNFDRWSSNTEFEGGTAPDFQSADGDSGDATSNSAVQAFSFRIKLDDTSNRHHLFAHPDSGDDPRAYWKSVDSAWAFDSGGAQVDNATGDSNPTDIRIIICGSDGSNTYIYVYDKDGNLVTDANASGSLNAISDTETFNFGYLSGADNHDGELDQFYFHDQWLDSQQRTDLLNNYYL